MYKFCFKYPDDEESLITLPLAPEEFKTKVGNKNKTIDLIQMGEVNIIKDIGLRDFEFKILLPKDNQLCEDKEDFREPIFYLNKFREFKERRKAINLIIIRFLQNNKILFSGNVEVTLEDYTVEEKAGEEGDFYVDLSFKEYKRVKLIYTNEIGTVSEDGKIQITQEVQRTLKESEDSYTVKSGDSLWKIAKLQMNDGSRYKEIAELNNITSYDSIEIGSVLKLP